MKFEVESAKNGEFTLKVNGLYIYSKYSPKIEAQNYIIKEFDANAKGYLLIGLGLGYHLDKLIQLAKAPIVVVLLDNEEINLYSKYSENNNLENISLFSHEINSDLKDFQVLLPGSFLNAFGENHALYDFLQDIKIRQRSFKRLKELLEYNFKANLKLKDSLHIGLKSTYLGKAACLVSAGPSLDASIEMLKLARSKEIYIICVGSALKVLLKYGIEPDAIIITDAQDNTQRQLNDTNYKGTLFYLCTANDKTVAKHKGARIMLLQEGYHLAEQIVTRKDLLETGGSVATTAFSLLEYMGFESVFLFGQDLGFSGEHTHSINSTSTKKTLKKAYKQIKANNGVLIKTTPNLYSYLRWFEYKFKKSNVKVYNLAEFGAKIEGTKYLTTKDFQKIIKIKSSCI